MNPKYTCDTCCFNTNGDCPHYPRPAQRVCNRYTPDGELWDSIRRTLCPGCPSYMHGFCNMTALFVEETPASDCDRFIDWQYDEIEAKLARQKVTSPQEREAQYQPRPAGQPYSAPARPQTPAPALAPTPAPRRSEPLPEVTTPISREAERRQQERRSEPAAKNAPIRRQEQPVRAKRPFSLHLYFLNPFAILGVLIIFLAFGFCFHVTPWDIARWQTSVCTLGLMLAVSLVWGLVWGVMNPQCRPLRFALAACFGVCAAISFWQTETFLQLLIAVGAGFGTLCACFLTAWLGTMATNALFGVKKRFEHRFSQEA